MKLFWTVLGAWILSAPLLWAGPVDVENQYGPPANEALVYVSTTPVKVSMTNDLNRTLVALNDDPENTIFYGDSAVTFQTGQKIFPGEKVAFVGKSAGFNFYAVTASGSALLRKVEYP